MTEKKRTAPKFSSFEGFLKTMNAVGKGNAGFVTDAIYVHDTLETADVIARSLFGDPADPTVAIAVYRLLDEARWEREAPIPVDPPEADETE